MGALAPERLQQQCSPSPGYRVAPQAPAARYAGPVAVLFGGPLLPLMAEASTTGRFAQAALSCPPTAATGQLTLDAGARSKPWRNPEAIECVFCLEGVLDVRCGPELNHTVRLERFDMLSIPANLRFELHNPGPGSSRTVHVLSVAPGGSYEAVFDALETGLLTPEAQQQLGVRFDAGLGDPLDAVGLGTRVTRFDTLVPYKKDLNRTSGLPPEATERLSAGNVFPLIVPEGHIGRSRTAPMYGHQGLYISIAECKAGTDGPPPHAHSDTQESFFVLDGTFDICTGFNNEVHVAVKPGDLVAVPNKVMRSFRNTTGRPARLLVIIQGPDRMSDTVSFSRDIGREFEDRFGAGIIGAYAQIRMTFDAEDRLAA